MIVFRSKINQGSSRLLSLSFSFKKGRVRIQRPSESVEEEKDERPISQKILNLKDFIKKKEKEDPVYLLSKSPQKLFVLGVEPVRFRHELFAYFKYGFWHSTKLGQSKLQSFISELEAKEAQNLDILKEDPSSWNAHQNIKLIKQYRKHLATILYPTVVSQMKICQKYIQILIKYLSETQKLDDMSISYIFSIIYQKYIQQPRVSLNDVCQRTQQCLNLKESNPQYILYTQNSQREFINERDYGWMMISAFDLFISKLQFKELNWRYKSLMIIMGKTLRSNNLKLLEFVKKELQNEKKQIAYYDFMAGLNLLSINKSFPYQFFYQNKRELLSILEAADNFSQRKVKNALIMLEIFSRERLMYCEKIINSLLVVLQENLLASDINQLVRILYYYSKLKSSIKHDFVIKIVQRIEMFLDIVTSREYGLIIKAVANLNYQNGDLVEKLKDMNYELFLTNLKYGCEKMGSYYQAILDQIEKSYRQDKSRYERFDDQGIPQVVMKKLQESNNQGQRNVQIV